MVLLIKMLFLLMGKIITQQLVRFMLCERVIFILVQQGNLKALEAEVSSGRTTRHHRVTLRLCGLTVMEYLTRRVLITAIMDGRLGVWHDKKYVKIGEFYCFFHALFDGGDLSLIFCNYDRI